MSDALGAPVRRPDGRLPLTTIYARLVALLLLAAGLARACMVLGITPDGQTFADLAPAWRAGATTLVLVDIFAAVGLWVGRGLGPGHVGRSRSPSRSRCTPSSPIFSGIIRSASPPTRRCSSASWFYFS